MNWADDSINFKECLGNEYWSLLIKNNHNILQSTEDKLNLEISRAKRCNEYVFPNKNDVFKVFNLCNLDKIKVVILGQDVYHSDEKQANGIAFSVNQNIQFPPSLKNIYKELLRVYPGTKVNGDLTDWVRAGVFLLNCSLTVIKRKPGSHMDIWSDFTDIVISEISRQKNGIVFCLWGKWSEKKEHLIDKQNGHIILKCSHPSPLSAYKTDSPFIGSNIFKHINENLDEPISW